MGERRAAGDEPDVLTLHAGPPDAAENGRGGPEPAADDGGGLLLAPPKSRIIDESDTDFCRRKQNSVVIRHVSDDRVVAMIEIVSRGNKSTRLALDQFVGKVAKFLERGIQPVALISEARRRRREGERGRDRERGPSARLQAAADQRDVRGRRRRRQHIDEQHVGVADDVTAPEPLGRSVYPPARLAPLGGGESGVGEDDRREQTMHGKRPIE
jgi:hypothetical protein